MSCFLNCEIMYGMQAAAFLWAKNYRQFLDKIHCICNNNECFFWQRPSSCELHLCDHVQTLPTDTTQYSSTIFLSWHQNQLVYNTCIYICMCESKAYMTATHMAKVHVGLCYENNLTFLCKQQIWNHCPIIKDISCELHMSIVCTHNNYCYCTVSFYVTQDNTCDNSVGSSWEQCLHDCNSYDKDFTIVFCNDT